MPPVPEGYRSKNPETTRALTPYWSSTTATIYHGDCLEVMPQLPRGSCHLIAVDPPYNIGWKYSEYQDNKSPGEYLDWCRYWLRECKRLLHPYGTLWVVSGVKYQANIKVIMDGLGLYWRDTIASHFTFGSRQTSKFTPSWVAMHYYTKHHEKWTWNPEPILVPSQRQIKYNDKRAVAKGKVPDSCWILSPKDEPLVCLPSSNMWLTSRVCGTFKERTTHPCQMSLAILERIILSTSNPGDMVCDPMSGSFTSGEAALKHGRSFVGIELSEGYVKDIGLPRLKKVKQLPT